MRAKQATPRSLPTKEYWSGRGRCFPLSFGSVPVLVPTQPFRRRARLAGCGDTHYAAFAPATMSALQGSTHHLHISSALAARITLVFGGQEQGPGARTSGDLAEDIIQWNLAVTPGTA